MSRNGPSPSDFVLFALVTFAFGFFLGMLIGCPVEKIDSPPESYTYNAVDCQFRNNRDKEKRYSIVQGSDGSMIIWEVEK